MKADASERLELARAIAEYLDSRLPGQILLAGVFGSTARGNHTPWSDLEMLYVVSDESTLKPSQFLYRDVVVNLVLTHERELHRGLTESPWPLMYWMYVLDELKIVCGNVSKRDQWLEMAEDMPQARFHQALEESLPWLIYEPSRRVLSCRDRRQVEDAHLAAIQFLSDLKVALSLLNRVWGPYCSLPVNLAPYWAIAASFALEKVPDRYESLAGRLWKSTNLDEMATLTTHLFEGFCELVTQEGIQLPRNYQRLEDLPLSF